jgi:hypothetical protein
MKKERITKHFNEDEKDLALQFYNSLDHATLIWSQHWASKGYWVEHPQGRLSKMDHIISKK